MKKVLVIVAVLLFGSVTFATNAPNNAISSAGSQLQQVHAIASTPLTTENVAMAPGEGGPLPTCQPGHCTQNNNLREVAGEGGPLPTCQPGHCTQNNNLREIAGEGGPLPTCQPGHCTQNNNLRLIAGEGGPLPTCQPGHCTQNNNLFEIMSNNDRFEAVPMS